ncbi:hypothetical protein [Stenotrophomonas humi]|uniref:hypothetical protein n=1 Tax=Stenotrophomonas humi TaxID=405444 RepID=UPI000AEB53B4|nr:hypothetical protein [Stenotrophomonas humi]
MSDVIESLRAAHKRNPDGIDVLSMACGIPKKRLMELIRGKGDPLDKREQMILEAMR